MKKSTQAIVIFSVPVLLSGCAVGYNTTLFMTKSNIGIDIDTKPPTAEISIARREGVIAPGFEDGQTPPLVASFRTNEDTFNRFFFGVKSTFAGGDAAVAIVQGPAGRPVSNESGMCLSQKPDPTTFLGFDNSIPDKGKVKPFFFGTDTSFGLKVAWSGMTGQIPDTIRLGFNRKEFALAPMFGTDVTNCTMPGTTQRGSYAVWMPSFLAVLDSDAKIGTALQTGAMWNQYIATGSSALTLANKSNVRRMLMDEVYPTTDAQSYIGKYDSADPTVHCVDNWLDAQPDNPRKLQTWWTANKLPGFASMLIATEEYKEKRAKFILQNSIACP